MTDFKTSHNCSLSRNRAGQRYALLLAVALALTFSVDLHAAATGDSTWGRYFPHRPTAPVDEAGWAELAKIFPNRVKPALPAAASTLKPPPATQAEVRPGIEYVRVRQLANDLTAVADALEKPRVILDVRYVRGDLDEALQFGALLAHRSFKLEVPVTSVPPKQLRATGQITICLINRATSGPLEAVLDALQSAGDVLLVGTQSAGDTGRFVAAANSPEWRVIADDYRRASGPSLLDVGVTPGLFVETTPEAEDAAYLAFDAGRPVAELLDAPVEKPRFDEARLQQHFNETRSGNGGTRPAPPPTPPAEDPAESESTKDASEKKKVAKADGATPFDRSLQRAVSTLVAQEVLREAQPSK